MPEAPGPLDLDQVKLSFRTAFLNMQVTVLDQNGNPVTLSPDPNGNIIAFADAVAEGLFDVLKSQVLILVNGGQPVQVNPTSGNGATLPNGTGLIE